VAGVLGPICRSPACLYIEVAPAKADTAWGRRTAPSGHHWSKVGQAGLKTQSTDRATW